MFGTVPPAMSGACGCIVNEELVIFGGCCDDGQTNEVKQCSVFSVFSKDSLFMAVSGFSITPSICSTRRSSGGELGFRADRCRRRETNSPAGFTKEG